MTVTGTLLVQPLRSLLLIYILMPFKTRFVTSASDLWEEQLLACPPCAYLKPSQSFVCGLVCPCWDVLGTGCFCCPPVLPPLPQGPGYPRNSGWSWGALTITFSVKRNPGDAQIPFSGCFSSSMLFNQNTEQNGSPLSSACFSCPRAHRGLPLTHFFGICHTLLSTRQGSGIWCPSWWRNARGLPDPWLPSSWRGRQPPRPHCGLGEQMAVLAVAHLVQIM